MKVNTWCPSDHLSCSTVLKHSCTAIIVILLIQWLLNIHSHALVSIRTISWLNVVKNDLLLLLMRAGRRNRCISLFIIQRKGLVNILVCQLSTCWSTTHQLMMMLAFLIVLVTRILCGLLRLIVLLGLLCFLYKLDLISVSFLLEIFVTSLDCLYSLS